MTDDAQTLHLRPTSGALAEVVRVVRETEQTAVDRFARSVVTVTLGSTEAGVDVLGSIANGDHARMAHYLRQVADCVEKADRGGEGITVDTRLSMRRAYTASDILTAMEIGRCTRGQLRDTLLSMVSGNAHITPQTAGDTEDSLK